MSGYPAIPNRATFGPTLVDELPVIDAETELGAEAVNLAFWQTAGAGRTAPRAMLKITGATPVVTYQALAWDADGELALITPVRVGAGQYTVTFATTYTDEKGNAVAFTPRAAIAQVQGGTTYLLGWTDITGQVVTIYTRDNAGTPTESNFILLVW